MLTHSSILTWRIQWTEEPGRLQSIGLQRVGHYGSDLACTHYWGIANEAKREQGMKSPEQSTANKFCTKYLHLVVPSLQGGF